MKTSTFQRQIVHMFPSERTHSYPFYVLRMKNNSNKTENLLSSTLHPYVYLNSTYINILQRIDLHIYVL